MTNEINNLQKVQRTDAVMDEIQMVDKGQDTDAGLLQSLVNEVRGGVLSLYGRGQ